VICNKGFKHLVSFVRHMKMHSVEDKGDREFKCQQCGKQFTCSKNLKQHTNIHTGEGRYECVVCDRRFTHSSQLSNHIKIHSKNDEVSTTFVCEWQDCGRKFKTLQCLRRHFRTHTGDRRYECAVCNRRFMFSCNLSRHIRTHSNTDKVRKRTETS
jgi:KRAB domain-containing zinc finger protein